MDAITFSTQMTQEKFTACFLYITRKSLTYRAIMIFGGIMALTVMGYLFFDLKTTDGNFPYFQTFFAIYAFLILPLTLRRLARISYHKNKIYNELITYKITETDIEWQGASVWEKKSWSEYEKIRIFDNILALSILKYNWTHIISLDTLKPGEIVQLTRIIDQVQKSRSK